MTTQDATTAIAPPIAAGSRVIWTHTKRIGRGIDIRLFHGTVLAIEGEVAVVQPQAGRRRKRMPLAQLRPDAGDPYAIMAAIPDATARDR